MKNIFYKILFVLFIAVSLSACAINNDVTIDVRNTKKLSSTIERVNGHVTLKFKGELSDDKSLREVWAALSCCEGTVDLDLRDAGVSSINLYFNSKDKIVPKALSSFLMPDDVIKEIGDYLFVGCKNLKNFDISTTLIGAYAFYGCTGLAGTIKTTISTIKEGAFCGCKNIKGLIFGNKLPKSTKLKNIGANAFYECTSLTDITIYATEPPEVGKNAFYKCPIKNIYVPSSSVNAYKTSTGWSDYADKISAITE